MRALSMSRRRFWCAEVGVTTYRPSYGANMSSDGSGGVPMFAMPTAGVWVWRPCAARALSTRCLPTPNNTGCCLLADPALRFVFFVTRSVSAPTTGAN